MINRHFLPVEGLHGEDFARVRVDGKPLRLISEQAVSEGEKQRSVGASLSVASAKKDSKKDSPNFCVEALVLINRQGRAEVDPRTGCEVLHHCGFVLWSREFGVVIVGVHHDDGHCPGIGQWRRTWG